MTLGLKGNMTFDPNDEFVWLVDTIANGAALKVGDPVDKAALVPGRLEQLFQTRRVAPVGPDGRPKKDDSGETVASLERKLAAALALLAEREEPDPAVDPAVEPTPVDPVTGDAATDEAFGALGYSLEVCGAWLQAKKGDSVVRFRKSQALATLEGLANGTA